MEIHSVALGYVGDKIRYILIIRVRFTTEFFFSNTDLSDWRGCFALGGTVFQTAVTISHGNPETSSRVTLASLGIGFQPNPPSMPLNNQKPTPIFLYFYLLIFFHPFNPYNPCSFHHWVFFRTRIYRIDADASLCERVSPLDKIRYIVIIRVRFTTDFFFRTRICRIDADASLLEVLSSILNKVIENR